MWSIGPCPTTFGCLDNTPAYGLLLWECYKAIKERHEHLLARSNSVDAAFTFDYPAASTGFDRTPMYMGGSEHNTLRHVNGIQSWLEIVAATGNHVAHWNEDTEVLTTWNTAAALLTSALGYDAFKQSAVMCDAYKRHPAFGRTLEELRMCIEKIQYCKVPSPAASYLIHHYANSDGATGKSNVSWAAAYAHWKSRPTWSLLAGGIGYKRAGGLLYYLKDLPYVPYFTYRVRQSDYAPKAHACRISYTIDLTRSGEKALVLQWGFVSKNFPEPWRGYVYDAITAYPNDASHYSWGNWNLVFYKNMFGSADFSSSESACPAHRRFTYAADKAEAYFHLRGSPADPTVWPTLGSGETIPQSGPHIVPHETWEYGNYRYGNPDA